MSLKCNQFHPFYSKLKYFENSMTFDPSVWVKGQDKISVMFSFGNFYSYTINRNWFQPCYSIMNKFLIHGPHPLKGVCLYPTDHPKCLPAGEIEEQWYIFKMQPIPSILLKVEIFHFPWPPWPFCLGQRTMKNFCQQQIWVLLYITPMLGLKTVTLLKVWIMWYLTPL